MSSNTKSTYSEAVLPIIHQVRETLLPFYGNVPFTEKNPTGKEDLLTELDTKVERFLRTEFKKLYPDIDFVGEEDGGDRTKERFWLVDPIDGTSHFVRGMPFCTTMVALIDKGDVVFSAVYDFVNDVMYHAEKGRGAYRNNEPMSISTRPLRLSRIEVSIQIDDPDRLQSYLALKKKCHIFHAGASGFELPLVALGKLDGSVHIGPGSKDYDVAPGLFLIKEAGGIVTNIGKQTYTYKDLDFIATNPAIHKELTEGSDALFPVRE
ncbi:MAG: hypothetical protein COV91_05740 [Candidatus Taylorbacteria bacterium CG11_big_fil_rev_8_21_14_0_20_46_11]|uniref:Inositol monophosphatase n=1 Tax=Candidatus Taylorbacteria bacterium CG11_big_fil_rev_8_21_14_0_20_46_11 TaxID=1975025 RepID=A0A2H0KCM2_9BACT|nr:MAG: hypothetical protein COV91_05740 [Candidatus Taylorbacteria bacterium CG11_big_fil_rev_8_21_14_0_20_46_11]